MYAMIKVLLVDDHELVRTGIQSLLAGQDDINVIGEAGTGEEAIKLVDSLRPDVVLMDINMPGIGGMEASHKINQKNQNVKIIILTVLNDGPVPQQMLNDGVQGYVTKTCSIKELVDAIQTVYAGGRYLCHQMASKLAFSHSAGNNNSPFEQLSRREVQVVMMTLQGKDLNEIAGNLVISSKTVSTYRHRVYEKLAVKNDVELMRLALKHNVTVDSV